jgi:GT2 family glycosyltransferase
MDITIVIAQKNRGKNIKLCLDSIRGTSPRPPVIVVDFGSNPKVEYPNEDWLQVINVTRNTELFHKARALNIGILASKTKYICVTDADQIFQKNFFGAVYDLLSTRKSSFIVCNTHFIKTYPKGFVLSDVVAQYDQLLQIAKNSGLRIHGDGCCQAVSRKWLLSVNGYDETYIGYGGEDSDLRLRAKIMGMSIITAFNRTSMIHLPHEKSGVYYSAATFAKNKAYYFEKTRTKQTIANAATKWGQL